MKSILGARGKRVLIAGALLVAGSVLVTALRYCANSRTDFVPHLQVPKPPLALRGSSFPCLSSLPATRHEKRFVVLHGPDWTLESNIEPKCLPEREVVLSVEVGRYFLSHPFTHRIGFWITNTGDRIYVRIFKSSGSDELDDSALDLVTNHKCKTHRSKNCYVQSARIVGVDM
jgi:TonB family protein